MTGTSCADTVLEFGRRDVNAKGQMKAGQSKRHAPPSHFLSKHALEVIVVLHGKEASVGVRTLPNQLA
jgi:hypothetical protein